MISRQSEPEPAVGASYFVARLMKACGDGDLGFEMWREAGLMKEGEDGEKSPEYFLWDFLCGWR